jgi:hypothetical protein
VNVENGLERDEGEVDVRDYEFLKAVVERLGRLVVKEDGTVGEVRSADVRGGTAFLVTSCGGVLRAPAFGLSDVFVHRY